jgi:FKBP-type peptidyl-prolyl cis-trans isomerase SlyD
MQIANNSVVSIEYTLKDDEGNILDSSEGRDALSYLHGAGNIIPGLENALAGKATGEELSVTVGPEEGYGERIEQLMQVVSRDIFESIDKIEVGMQFQGQSADEQPMIITITAIEGDDVTIDGNHPLAGVNLNFDIKIVDVRDATAEELAHGHVHEPGGPDHD